ncbi:hypothetical protein KEM55_003467, partial [Ascosphaera atra]
MSTTEGGDKTVPGSFPEDSVILPSERGGFERGEEELDEIVALFLSSTNQHKLTIDDMIRWIKADPEAYMRWFISWENHWVECYKHTKTVISARGRAQDNQKKLLKQRASELEEQQRSIDSQAEQLNDRTKQLDQLQDELARYRQQLQDTSNALHKAQSQWKRANTVLQTKKDMTAQIVTLQNEISDIRTQLEVADQAVERLHRASA